NHRITIVRSLAPKLHKFQRWSPAVAIASDCETETSIRHTSSRVQPIVRISRRFTKKTSAFWTGAALATSRREMNAKPQLQNISENHGCAGTRQGRQSIWPAKRYVFGSLLILTLLMLGYQVRSQNDSTHVGFDLVDKVGNIRKPPDYRDRYQAIGTY